MTSSGEIQAKGGYRNIDPDVGKATQFKKGQSGNPAGQPKGTKHINTWVQEILEDENFEAWIQDPREGIKLFQGVPIKALVKAQVIKAVNGDTLAYKALVDSGWTKRSEVENTGEITHKYEDMDDEQLEAVIKARKNRVSGAA